MPWKDVKINSDKLDIIKKFFEYADINQYISSRKRKYDDCESLDLFVAEINDTDKQIAFAKYLSEITEEVFITNSHQICFEFRATYFTEAKLEDYCLIIYQYDSQAAVIVLNITDKISANKLFEILPNDKIFKLAYDRGLSFVKNIIRRTKVNSKNKKKKIRKF